MPRHFASTALIFLLIASAGRAADWPTFQHNNARVATTDETLNAPLALRWVHSAPSTPQTAWSGPRSEPIEGHVMRHRVRFDDAIHVVVAGGRAYFGSPVDHQVYCVDAETGRSNWSFFTEGPVRLAPTVWQGKVYFGSDDGQVYCLSAESGELVWKLRPTPRDERLLARGQMISRWPIRTGVLVDEGVAYFGAGIFPHETVYLCAVDAATGKVIWKNDAISQQNAGRNDLSPQGYLLASDKLLFVPSGRSLPVAFDKQTGEMVHGRKHAWRTTAGGVVGGTGAVLADGQIFSSGPHHFLALDQQSGNIGHAWIAGRQMTFVGENAVIATGGAIIKVDRRQHAQASTKRQELFLKLRRAPADERREIEKERARLAKVGIEWAAANKADGALIVAGDLVFAGGAGQLAAYRLSDGKEVWQAEVEGEVRGLAAGGGALFASTTAGKIYAFGEAKATPADWQVRRHPAQVQQPQVDKRFVASAAKILKATDVDRGFCLVAESESGQLAYELARQSDLSVYGLEDDDKKLAAARQMLSRAGLYGHRVTLLKTGPSAQLPRYFANLVVSEQDISAKELRFVLPYAAPHVKPHGGVICVSGGASLAAQAREILADDQFQIDAADGSLVVTRGALPGAGTWTHQYGDAGNTSNSRDHRVKGGLGVLWYGDPGPSKMINRHEGAAAPLSVGGRMFVQGTDSVMAYDIYNGLFLWEKKNPGALRTGVFNNEDTSNLAATEDALFVCVDDTCTEYDAATGRVRRVHKIPESSDDAGRAWGYVAAVDGTLYGTSTVRSELRRELRRRGRKVANATDAIFAIDLPSGDRKWTHRGQNIMHMTIAIDGGRVHFIDSTISSEEREAFLREDKSELAKLTGKQREQAEKELKRRDIRRAVALDAGTGEQLWSTPVDVTDCSHLAIGGGQMTLMAADGHVVICGANANGHFWRQFLSGEFSRRRLLVLDARTGEKRWAEDANYRHRPIVVGEQIIAEPWAFDLATGEQVTRAHPLTGEPTKWMFSRPGHHCGAISASPNTLFFRSGFIGYYDLYDDSGTRHFAGQRLGCWINALPAGGVVAIPEASAGCVCLFSIASTVVLEPREDRQQSWGIYSADGLRTPVKHMALNFGAPGDRRDEQGRLWLAYPRPRTVGRLEYDFDVKPRLADGGGYFDHNEQSLEIAGADVPWLFASGVRGLRRCELPLLGKDDQPARYTVKLLLAAPENGSPQATFDVRLNGTAVDRRLDVPREAGGPQRALVRTYEGVPVERTLTVEFVPHGDANSLPLLAGLEIVKEE